MSEFYVNLPSNASLARYPNNKGGDYTVQLPETLHLGNDWEVGLAEMTFKQDWPSVIREDAWIRIDKPRYEELNEAATMPLADKYSRGRKNYNALVKRLFASAGVELSYLNKTIDPNGEDKWRTLQMSLLLKDYATPRFILDQINLRFYYIAQFLVKENKKSFEYPYLRLDESSKKITITSKVAYHSVLNESVSAKSAGVILNETDIRVSYSNKPTSTNEEGSTIRASAALNSGETLRSEGLVIGNKGADVAYASFKIDPQAFMELMYHYGLVPGVSDNKRYKTDFVKRENHPAYIADILELWPLDITYEEGMWQRAASFESIGEPVISSKSVGFYPSAKDFLNDYVSPLLKTALIKAGIHEPDVEILSEPSTINNQLTTTKVKIQYQGHYPIRIAFSQTLLSIMGFIPDQLSDSRYIIPSPPSNGQLLQTNVLGNYVIETGASFIEQDLKRSVSSLWVYTGIVEPHIVGHSQAPLLRVVNVKPSISKNETRILTYTHPHYYPLLLHDINDINIRIYNIYGITPIPFHDVVTLLLHFRKRQPLGTIKAVLVDDHESSSKRQRQLSPNK